MITIVNRHHYKGNGIYIGRGTQWGNPYTHLELSKTLAEEQVATREESIEKYRGYISKKWLEDTYFQSSVKELARRHLRGDNVVLACSCKQPDREVACHGDILKEFILWVADIVEPVPSGVTDEDPF